MSYESQTPDQTSDRRGFFAAASAIVIGGFLAIVPTAAALAVFLNPLRKRAGEAKFVRVTTLDALPTDGTPREFPVIANRVDAWNRSREPVGAVYLRLPQGADKPDCLSATCPHAGCFVAFDGPSDEFKCPCHNSAFAVDGAIIPPSPSPRPMDSLACKVEGNDVLVKFEDFYTGRSDKVVKQ
ncbi:MAG: Rieske (2Fe-2S) protein [Planctomycetota bacterium]|nr:MAG: Rieske (2Fe-2S) protein [Planctomycetota bacterium]